MHTGKNQLRRGFYLPVVLRCPGNAGVDSDIPVYEGSDAFVGTAVAAAGAKHNGTEYEGVVNQPLFSVRIGRMQHIGRYEQKLPLFCPDFLTTADKFTSALFNPYQLQLAVPVHGHAHV